MTVNCAVASEPICLLIEMDGSLMYLVLSTPLMKIVKARVVAVWMIGSPNHVSLVITAGEIWRVSTGVPSVAVLVIRVGEII